MSIKSILCIFGGSKLELGAVCAAFGLAKAYGSRLCFLHISPDPSAYASFYDGDVLVSSNIIEAITKESEARFQQAEKYITEMAARYHVPLGGLERPAHHASAKFVHLTGSADVLVAREGRLCDLIVMGRGVASANALYDSAVIAALFNTGRPVLLLPEVEDDDKTGFSGLEFKNISLAWSGSLESARAMYNALPFLENAEKIYALTAEGRGETYDLEAESALMEYLHTHAINATAIVVAAGNRTPEEALLLRAKELNSDLLVIGAYGHSRFREMMFGGVTNYMLEKANIPLLLSH